MVRRNLAAGLVALLAALLLVACGSSERSGGEGTGHPGEPAAKTSTVPSPPPSTLEETNRQLNDIIEFDRDIQLALAVYLNHRLAPADRQFLCAVLHTKAAKQYLRCP